MPRHFRCGIGAVVGQWPYGIENENLTKMDSKELQKIPSGNVRDQRKISQEWMEIFSEIENWYGDIQKRETGDQLLKRLQRTFYVRKRE